MWEEVNVQAAKILQVDQNAHSCAALANKHTGRGIKYGPGQCLICMHGMNERIIQHADEQ